MYALIGLELFATTTIMSKTKKVAIIFYSSTRIQNNYRREIRKSLALI